MANDVQVEFSPNDVTLTMSSKAALLLLNALQELPTHCHQGLCERCRALLGVKRGLRRAFFAEKPLYPNNGEVL